MTEAVATATQVTGRQVLFVERGGSGGLAQFAHALCATLAATGAEVTLLTSPREPVVALGAPYRVVERLHHLYDRHKAASLGLGMLDSLIVIGVALTSRTRVVAIHSAIPARFDLVLVSLLQILGRRVVWIAHNLAERDWGRQLKPWAQRLYARVDAVVSLSDFERRNLISQVPAATTRVFHIPHGEYRHHIGTRLDQSDARARLGLPADVPIFLFFGYLKKYKGLDLFLDALSALSRQGVPVHGVVVGQPSAQVPVDAVEAQVRDLDLGRVVTFHPGYATPEETDAWFSAADAVVLPYRSATQSGVLHLAYGYGRPVVVTDGGGMAEYVTEGETGELARPDDAASLAAAMARLISSPQHLGKIQSHLVESPPERFEWPNVAAAFAAVLWPGEI
ncbi:MAG: glycosyltransferase family 4 protein [Acidimicrobiia bacterium]|nr:glycosyltransferase family 4 protein [Acidimicrobiia bacterium]